MSVTAVLEQICVLEILKSTTVTSSILTNDEISACHRTSTLTRTLSNPQIPHHLRVNVFTIVVPTKILRCLYHPY